MVKIVKSMLQLGVCLKTDVEGFEFTVNWDGPNSQSEIACSNANLTSVSKTQVKLLVSAFKEAETQLNAQIALLEEKIKPYADYIASIMVEE